MIVFGPTAVEHKLFPKVLAISGKTLMVSSAGKRTTILAAIRIGVRMNIEVSALSNPIVKLAKFKLTDDLVFAPKKDAAELPNNR